MKMFVSMIYKTNYFQNVLQNTFKKNRSDVTAGYFGDIVESLFILYKS